MLLSLRDFQDDKADVIQKYTSDEARNLKVCLYTIKPSLVSHLTREQAYGELPETAKLNETDAHGEDEYGGFLFTLRRCQADWNLEQTEMVASTSEQTTRTIKRTTESQTATSISMPSKLLFRAGLISYRCCTATPVHSCQTPLVPYPLSFLALLPILELRMYLLYHDLLTELCEIRLNVELPKLCKVCKCCCCGCARLRYKCQ